MTCDGNCLETHGEHNGEIEHVIVEGNGISSTTFDYCQNAIQEDKNRGFEVTIINESKQKTFLYSRSLLANFG